jgi:hypothetical protein
VRIKNQITLEGWVFLLRAYQSLAEHENPGRPLEAVALDEELPRTPRRTDDKSKESKTKTSYKLNGDEHIRAYLRLKTEYDSFYRARAERAKLTI